MAALTLNSIRLCTLALGAALALAAPALAGDVSVRLDSSTGFSVKNSTGAIERLRVDEATGNVSRNGALFVHTTGTSNTFVGSGAGNPSTTGVGRNSAFGASALQSNTTGNANTGVGSGALQSNTTGYANSAVGEGALYSNTTGTLNSAVGRGSLRLNTEGYANSAFGDRALPSNTTGTRNSAVGFFALRYNTTGSRNSAVGESAMFDNTTGSRNTAVGRASLGNNTTGSNNTAVGYGALADTTGNRNVAVGNYAGFNQTTGSDNVYLANEGAVAESGQIKIGTAGTHTVTFVAGIRGVTTANANAIPVLIDSAGQLGTVSSSRSVKQEIRDMGDATDRLLALRPVTFRYRQAQTLPSGGEVPPEYGLIADEVAEVFGPRRLRRRGSALHGEVPRARADAAERDAETASADRSTHHAAGAGRDARMSAAVAP